VLPQVALYLLTVNMAAFAAFWWDKRCAERHAYRVPEKTLLTLAAIGGAFGATAGQQVFRHKTYKEPFRTYLRWLVALNVAGLVALSSSEFRERVLQELLG
jgi:uncharacterized membrane protein YsdA (DUF1294 family)